MGYANVDLMLTEITWGQLNEWNAYFEIKAEIEEEAEKDYKRKMEEEQKKQRNMSAAKQGRW
ncbi:hypothetical protein H8707_02500 [Tissierellaceae bacterium BX21]|uniref:Uncharacterized protein n=1 Tax=Paratissierella segnis TaxID=2763679 RepID=A0A926IJX5_9FIRM|nr:hypothetical protein [Paratissierella segnis]